MGTLPLKDFLVGSDNMSGAHARYRPGDLTAMKCRAELKNIQAKHKGEEARGSAFTALCAKFQPVMRHFFYENFASSGVLLERRLAYTRSAAASSMIGYVLGLGDRHMQNILIDKSTAELIHIDLGIAFEQGKILPTPERVPFRLTRDIVDGFGPCGVEGTFRQSCEVTLKVLKSHRDVVMTLLEVLMFDPLFTWSLTPTKAYKLQYGHEPDPAKAKEWQQGAGSKQNNNSMAERALLRVSQKLNGVEEDCTLSVEGQENLLIQQARDPARLSGLFDGWQPYM